MQRKELFENVRYWFSKVEEIKFQSNFAQVMPNNQLIHNFHMKQIRELIGSDAKTKFEMSNTTP